MRGITPILLLGVAAIVPACASAMSMPARPHHACTVSGGEKLGAEAAHAEELCATVERMVAGRAPGVDYSARINIVSASRLSTSLTVNGKPLPEQHFAVMDGKLGPSAIEHFADALATEIAKAAGG